jgi:large subunit ribosomal protein L5
MAKEPKEQQPKKEGKAPKQQGAKAASPAAETPKAAKASSRKADARLRRHYQERVIPALVKEFGYKNVMAVPKIDKISVNIGLGEATQNAKLMDGAVNELTQIAGQKPVITKAKKSIAAFKLREGMSIGTMVTLRGDRMYEFLDRLMNVALPRVRDFRGVSSKSFDGRGNYTLKAWRCCAKWVCRSGSNEEQQEIHGNNRQGRKRREEAEIQNSASQPLFPLRTAARLSSQVQPVPYLLPEARPGRRDPGRDQG